MFDWVLNTPIFLDGYYLRCCSRMQFKIVVLSSFLSFKLFFFNPKCFYEMAICCIIVIKIYNNAVLYKLNAFIRKQYFMVQLEVNWRKRLKPLTDAALHIFFQKTPLISYVWILFSHIYSIFCDLDLFQTRVDSCWTRVGLVLTLVGRVLTPVGLMLIHVDSCRTRVDSCQTRIDSC